MTLDETSPESALDLISTVCDVLLTDPEPDIRVDAAETLKQIGAGNAIALTALLRAVRDDPDPTVRKAALKVILSVSVGNQNTTPSLLERILESLSEIQQTLQKMSDQPKVQMNFNAPVTGVAGSVEGDFIVNPASQGMIEALAAIRQLLVNLQQRHPTATEAEAPIILRAELESIQQTQPQRWAILRRDLLNRERWFQGGKAAVVEMTKDLSEKNTLVKGAIAFLEAFSEEPEK